MIKVVELLNSLKQGQTLPIHDVSVSDAEIERYLLLNGLNENDNQFIRIGAKWMRDELTTHSR